MSERAIANALIAWFAREKRDLPWRRTSDPYAIWVSEVMLQQTQVDTVLPYYDQFLARFPTVGSLARASEDEVLGLWQGLGYYSRARNLHKAARAIVASGGFPQSAAELRELPGFGPYTAGAVASLAFGERVSAVDGNVKRVVSRLFAERDLARVSEIVARLIPDGRARDFNEALMELGALVCAPRAPRCGACPLAARCEARKRDAVADFPPRARRRPPKDVRAFAALVERRGRVLLERRERGLLAGTWGLPWVEGNRQALATLVGEISGGTARAVGDLASLEWTFTHKRWRLQAVRVEARGSGGTWVARTALGDFPMSGVQRALLARLGLTAEGASKGSLRSPERGRESAAASRRTRASPTPRSRSGRARSR